MKQVRPSPQAPPMLLDRLPFFLPSSVPTIR